MSSPLWWGDWRPTLTPHTGNLQPTDLLECTMIVGGLPVNTAITGQQIIDGASGGGAVGYYAQYQDDITQPLVAVNVGQPTKFRTMDFSNGVTVVSDTQITIANTGIYNLQFSFQFQNSDTQEHDVTIWLRKNGADVAGSAGFVAVVSSHGGTPGHCIPSWNYLLDAVGGDYYELYWSATSTQVTMQFYPAGSPPPSTASAIFTVTQQAGIIAGTGMTALNGLSADVQTISTGTTGTDFNVVSSGSNHEFNIPTASATNRGALSSANWSTFNSKASTGAVTGTGITMSTARILGRTTAGTGAIEEISIGSGLTLSAGTLTASGGGLTVGTTAIASGTDGRVLFQAAGVLQQDASFFWDNTNKRLGLGATPATNVRLDVRAQGALSSDIAFRIRNSGNTQSMFEFFGDGTFWFRNNAGTTSCNYTGTGINFNNSGGIFTIGNVLGGININPSGIVQLSTSGGNFGLRTTGNISFGGSPVDGTGTNVFMQQNGTAPSTNQIDRFLLYSADIVAGNAAPHFRTENGDIVKLYRVGGWGLPTGTFTRTTFNTATVTTAQLAERVAALIQDLRDNHQLLKA